MAQRKAYEKKPLRCVHRWLAIQTLSSLPGATFRPKFHWPTCGRYSSESPGAYAKGAECLGHSAPEQRFLLKLRDADLDLVKLGVWNCVRIRVQGLRTRI